MGQFCEGGVILVTVGHQTLKFAFQVVSVYT